MTPGIRRIVFPPRDGDVESMHCSSCSGFAVPAHRAVTQPTGMLQLLLTETAAQPLLFHLDADCFRMMRIFRKPALKILHKPVRVHPFVPSQRKPYHRTDLCPAFRTAPFSYFSP